MKLLNLAAFSAAALALPGCVQIVEAAWTPPSADPAKVPAGTYAVEPQHTEVMFGVKHMGITSYFGTFTNASGTLAIDPRNLAAMKLAVSVPTASVLTPSPKLDGELKAADWLDATQYPAMTYRTTGIHQTGANTADVAGQLTLHGITRPLALHASFNAVGINPLSRKESIGFQLAGTLKRSDFGVSKYVPLVSDDVDVIISAAFEKK